MWSFIRKLSGILGLICLYVASSTFDYYVLELGMPEPMSVTVMMVVGVTLILPVLAGWVYEAIRER